MTKEIWLREEADTENLGRRIGTYLHEGGCVALYGDLGTGKSVIARGIGLSLGIDHIGSPTFTILQRYTTHPVFYHIDAYRLSSADELFDAGFADCLTEKAILAVEWADLVEEALPQRRLNISLFGSGCGPRKAVLSCPDTYLPPEFFSALTEKCL